MDGKIIQFDNSVATYKKVAQRKAEEGEYEKALGLFFSIKNWEKDSDVLMGVADVYADMGLLELSNRCWFKYLDVAPLDNRSVAFEELAINYFYLEDFWASSYYFHKKIETDGYISKENMDQEILDFFSGEEQKKAFYHVAYPPERADYSGKIKMAKHFIAGGKFDEAVRILSAIPKECLEEEACGDLATAYFMNGELERAESVCRDSIERHGENITAYCNLSTVFDMKKDYEKSEYYYKKALSFRKGDRIETYKIATCAIERDDHVTAKDCLETILKERPYDTAMRFFYGIAHMNLGDYDLAENEFSQVYRIDATDKVVKFYLDFAKFMRSGGGDTEKLLPIKYVKELPEKVEKKRVKRIKELVKHPEKIPNAIKKAEVKEILVWGLKCKDSETIRECAYVLSTAYDGFSKKAILDALLDNETVPELKRVLVYALTINGYKEKYGVVAGSIYIKVKPKKLPFEKKDQTGMFVRAYALALSRAVFWDLGSLDKLVSSANTVFKKLNGVITEQDVTNDELSALMVYACKFKKFDNNSLILHLFEIKKDRFNQLIKLLGEGK